MGSARKPINLSLYEKAKADDHQLEDTPNLEFGAFRRPGKTPTSSRPTSRYASPSPTRAEARPIIQNGKVIQVDSRKMRAGAPRLGGLGLGGAVARSAGPTPPASPTKPSPPASPQRIKRKPSPSVDSLFKLAASESQHPAAAAPPSTSTSVVPPINTKAPIERPFLSPELPGKPTPREGDFALDRIVPEATSSVVTEAPPDPPDSPGSPEAAFDQLLNLGDSPEPANTIWSEQKFVVEELQMEREPTEGQEPPVENTEFDGQHESTSASPPSPLDDTPSTPPDETFDSAPMPSQLSTSSSSTLSASQKAARFLEDLLAASRARNLADPPSTTTSEAPMEEFQEEEEPLGGRMSAEDVELPVSRSDSGSGSSEAGSPTSTTMSDSSNDEFFFSSPPTPTFTDDTVFSPQTYDTKELEEDEEVLEVVEPQAVTEDQELPAASDPSLEKILAGAVFSGGMAVGWGAWRGLTTVANAGWEVWNRGAKVIDEPQGAEVIQEEREEVVTTNDVDAEERENVSSIGDDVESSIMSTEWGDVHFPAPKGFVEDLKQAMLEVGEEDLAASDEMAAQAQIIAYESAQRVHDDESSIISRRSSVYSTGPFPTIPKSPGTRSAVNRRREKLSPRGATRITDSLDDIAEMLSNEAQQPRSRMAPSSPSLESPGQDSVLDLTQFIDAVPDRARSIDSGSSSVSATQSPSARRHSFFGGSRPQKMNSIDSEISDHSYVDYGSLRRRSMSQASDIPPVPAIPALPVSQTATPRRSCLRQDSKDRRRDSVHSAMMDPDRSVFSVRFGNVPSGLGLRSVAEDEAAKAGGEDFGVKWVGVGRGRYGNLQLKVDEATDETYAEQVAVIKKKWRSFGSGPRDWSAIKVD
ncbi:hypothetical protein MNV49_003288 [Pseudohyphozyma bogoriensis]|nr:hypothetical protein MNV49_003288 [Pseudohyphozyma bogoriensis]